MRPRSLPAIAPPELHAALLAALERFSEGGVVRDDITVLVLEYAPEELSGAPVRRRCRLASAAPGDRPPASEPRFSTSRRTADSAQAVPLGGGAAVCDHLVEEWTRTQPFPLRLITPAGARSVGAPSGRDLVRFGERDYARFSRAFERAATDEDPASRSRQHGGARQRCLRRAGFRGARRARLSRLHHLSRGCRRLCRGDLRPRMDPPGDDGALVSSRLRALLPDDGPAGMGETRGQRALFARADHAVGRNARGAAALLSVLSAGEDACAAVGTLVDNGVPRRCRICCAANSACPKTRRCC